MTKRTYGRTKAGKPIDDTRIEQFADEAERGYEPEQLRGKPRGRGRPPLGAAAKEVESVRLDPDLRRETERRAADEGVSVSEVIRRALQHYLRSA
jgi:predicted HicB family RNase H-like nuclease